MSLFKQEKKIQEILVTKNLSDEFATLVERINKSFGVVVDISKEIGTIDSILVVRKKNLQIKLSISAELIDTTSKRRKKEVDND